MTASVFVDTNVFVYAKQSSELLKQAIALDWLERLSTEKIGRISMQTLNECYSALTRKIRPALRPEDAWEYVSGLLKWNPRALDAEVVVRARAIELRYRLSWWDCLIVAAAQLQGCGTLLSEDMQDGAMYGSVTVRNPFADVVSDVEVSAVYHIKRLSREQDHPQFRRPTRFED